MSGNKSTEGTSRVPDKISPGKRKHQGIVDDFDIISQPGSVSGVGDDGKVMDVQNYFVILEKNVLTFFLSFSFFLLENSFDYKLSKRSRNEEDSEDKSGDEEGEGQGTGLGTLLQIIIMERTGFPA
jgi:hypothetical protein